MHNQRIECTVTGRVQMVLYRDFAQRKAHKLGLFGFVRNNNDGSVTVIAEGEHEKLERFIALLRRGSVLSKVDMVTVQQNAATGEFEDFLIVY